ncbi:EAL domain-containing protein [Paracoccus sp. p3-h83]|uniref:EAL domain-containing protein n=1 Tax=Paracoccus sp. p3-h83 TaxID=3342805 RepID=UPI0035B75FC9
MTAHLQNRRGEWGKGGWRDRLAGLGAWLGLVPAALAVQPEPQPDQHPEPQAVPPLTAEAVEDFAEALDQARAAGQDCLACLAVAVDPGADSRRLRIRLRAALRSSDLVATAGAGRLLILSNLSRPGDEGAALRLARRLHAATVEDRLPQSQAACLAALSLAADNGMAAGQIVALLAETLAQAQADAAPGLHLLAQPRVGRPAAAAPHRIDGLSGEQPRTDVHPDQHRSQPTVIAAPQGGQAGMVNDPARLAAALESGQIRAHFQPQLSADTGEITGFEALARWHHPDLGLLRPATFLPGIERAGLLRRMGEVMLTQAIDAMRIWSRAGYDVPAVSINVTHEELRDPLFATRLAWNLDRYELAPHRLVIEVLETVAADPARGQIVQNLRAAAAIGCRLDLDDFGMAPGALECLRDFPVHRIKIDRSFVTRCDHDPDQRRMLSAVLSMAERLHLQTVGEGVESAAEHGMLAQLGCDHVQGYAIARPMTLRETTLFIERQNRLIVATTPSARRPA